MESYCYQYPIDDVNTLTPFECIGLSDMHRDILRVQPQEPRTNEVDDKYDGMVVGIERMLDEKSTIQLGYTVQTQNELHAMLREKFKEHNKNKC